MQRQSSLGTPKTSRLPAYQTVKIGRVTSTEEYRKYGRIYVLFTDYGAPAPVWVVGEIDREPSEGDMVHVGYAEGRKDLPYLVGFVRNEAFTSNMVVVGKESVRLQLPASKDDREEHMLDDEKYLPKRNYMELTKDGLTINLAEGDFSIVTKKGTVKLDAKTAITFTSAGPITANGEDLTHDDIGSY